MRNCDCSLLFFHFLVLSLRLVSSASIQFRISIIFLVCVFTDPFHCFYMCVGGLDLEGIFRVSARVNEIEELRAAYRRGVATGSVDLTRWTELHVHACALKQWLRDLPLPLFSYELYDAFKWALGMYAHVRVSARVRV